MKHSVFAVTLIGCLLFAGSASAVERWDFGRLAYGSKVTKKPTWARDWDCSEGCSFKDDLDVEYITWESQEVVSKKFAISSDNRHKIPFGINYADSPQRIVKTVERRTGKTLKCIGHEDSRNIEPGTLFCDAEVIKGEFGVDLQLKFGVDGKLRMIQIWTLYF